MRNSSLRALTIPATGAVRLAEPSKHRRALTFSPNLSAGYTVAPDGGVSANAGLVVTAGGGCVTLTFEAVGTLVQQAWYGYNDTGTAITVGVLEAFDLPGS